MSITRPTDLTVELINQLETDASQPQEVSGHKIHVSELTSLPAFAYEKLRNIVDYKEENLLRKNAIRRFLKRQFLLPQLSQSPPVITLALIRELILSRYLKNDSLPEEIIHSLGDILAKYQRLLVEIKKVGCEFPRWREHILGLAAVECDNHLIPPTERVGYTTFATKIIRPVIELVGSSENLDRQNVQLVLTIERVLHRADRDFINYFLLRHYYPAWFRLPDKEAALFLAPALNKLLTDFTALAHDRLGKRLLPLVKRLLAPLVILRDALRHYQGAISELIHEPAKLDQTLRQTYQEYWRQTRRRIQRQGFHAMAYIFITKILLAILLELPYEKFILGEINYLPLTINLLFPPALMLTITLLIKSPPAENGDMIWQGIKEMVYGGPADFFASRRLVVRAARLWTKIFYALLYTLTVAASFSAVVFLLWRLGFNLLSGALFIFFVSLVSFFGINLRQQARQLKVVVGREGLSTFVLDFFSFPIVALGKWLSNTFDRYNFFIFILDFIFEAPFKTILKVIEDWFHFLKEKKEEML